MSYNSIIDIANSNSLLFRITASAASENVVNPDSWVQNHRWKFAATPGWGAKWEYARDTMTINSNPDIGAREDVINDNDILAAVQAVKTSEA
jgi:hypothetical protein